MLNKFEKYIFTMENYLPIKFEVIQFEFFLKLNKFKKRLQSALI